MLDDVPGATARPRERRVVWRRGLRRGTPAVVSAGPPPFMERGEATSSVLGDGMTTWPRAWRELAYTPDSSGSCPVLSPNASSRTPNLAIRLSDRLASGVPFG